MFIYEDNGKLNIVLGTASGPATTPDVVLEKAAGGAVTVKVAGTAIAAAAELPAVTTADNDKILKVVSGVWTAASAT